MRLLYCLVALGMLAHSAELRIDHVTVAGTKLAALQQAFQTATGLPTEYGGPHANHATEMALTSFPDGSYLEFIAIQAKPDPAAVVAHPWNKYMTGNAGPAAFAIRVTDIQAEVAHLTAAGLHVHSPEKSGRARPDGVRLDWETVDLGVGPRGSFFPFLIRDVTPRERRVYTTGKPTTTRATGVSKLIIGVADLDGAVERYRRAFNLPTPRMETVSDLNAKLAWFEGTPIVLARGTSHSSWVAERVRQYGDGLCAIILASTAKPSAGKLFGHDVAWANEAQLGWHLGFESSQ